MKKIIVGCVLPILVSSCSLVKLSPEGDNVAILTMQEVAQCTLTGETTVSVLSKVGVNRSVEKVAKELQILARNWAAERGGDAIVPTSEVEDGERSYNIYRCRP